MRVQDLRTEVRKRAPEPLRWVAPLPPRKAAPARAGLAHRSAKATRQNHRQQMPCNGIAAESGALRTLAKPMLCPVSVGAFRTLAKQISAGAFRTLKAIPVAPRSYSCNYQ